MIAAKIRNKYEKLNITIPKKATEFIIDVVDAVVAALSRTLQDPGKTSNIIANLPVIADEKKGADTLIKQIGEQYTKFLENVTDLKNQAIKTVGLSNSQLDNIEQITETISALSRPTTYATKNLEADQIVND